MYRNAYCWVFELETPITLVGIFHKFQLHNFVHIEPKVTGSYEFLSVFQLRKGTQRSLPVPVTSSIGNHTPYLRYDGVKEMASAVQVSGQGCEGYTGLSIA
jgi:hypothetical protein